MFKNNIIHELTDFILGRVAVAEKMFATRSEVKKAYENYDKSYNAIYSILKQSNQEHLLKTMHKAQVDYTYWTFKAIYIQALLDMHQLFINKD